MLVGRRAELDRLAVRTAAAAGGRGGLVLVGGEPGIGKSALVGAAADVRWGRCRETEGAPEHWPWTQPLARACGDPAALAAAVAARQFVLRGPDGLAARLGYGCR